MAEPILKVQCIIVFAVLCSFGVTQGPGLKSLCFCSCAGGGVWPAICEHWKWQSEDVCGALWGLCTATQPKPLQCSSAGAIPHGGAHEHVRLFQPGECTHTLCQSEQTTAKLQQELTVIICMCVFSGYQFQLPMRTSHPFPSHSHNQNSCSQDKIFYFSPIKT